MPYNFELGKEYLTKEELKAFEKFLDNEPVCGNTYRNPNGEERICLRVAYPEGVITDLTDYHTEREGFGRHEKRYVTYHTPLATVKGKESRVWWEAPKKHKRDRPASAVCLASEWFEWLGDGAVSREKPTVEIDEGTKRIITGLKAKEEKKVEQEDPDRKAKNARVRGN